MIESQEIRKRIDNSEEWEEVEIEGYNNISNEEVNPVVNRIFNSILIDLDNQGVSGNRFLDADINSGLEVEILDLQEDEESNEFTDDD